MCSCFLISPPIIKKRLTCLYRQTCFLKMGSLHWIFFNMHTAVLWLWENDSLFWWVPPWSCWKTQPYQILSVEFRNISRSNYRPIIPSPKTCYPPSRRRCEFLWMLRCQALSIGLFRAHGIHANAEELPEKSFLLRATLPKRKTGVISLSMLVTLILISLSRK